MKGVLLQREATVDKSFDFTGEFVPDVKLGGGQQSYESLRDAALVRTVYENDHQHQSQDLSQYFYTVTNKDDQNLTVELADRDRMWFSDRVVGSAWNNGAASKAANNAKSAWPDDYYDVTVTAKDAAGNSGNTTARVLLDNWTQTLTATPVTPNPNETDYRFIGAQYTANPTVKIYLVPSTITDGDSITGVGGILLGTVNTDADGNFDTIFTVTQTPAWVPMVPSLFLADYHNGDNIYQPRLDAVTPGDGQAPVEQRAGGKVASESALAGDFASSTSTTPSPAPTPAPTARSVATNTALEPPPATSAEPTTAEPLVLVMPESTGAALFGGFDLADWSAWDAPLG